MAENPRVSGVEAIRAFEALGFRHVRTKGSHHVLKKVGHPYLLSVPVHGSKELGVGLLKSLMKSAGCTLEQFEDALVGAK